MPVGTATQPRLLFALVLEFTYRDCILTKENNHPFKNIQILLQNVNVLLKKYLKIQKFYPQMLLTDLQNNLYDGQETTAISNSSG